MFCLLLLIHFFNATGGEWIETWERVLVTTVAKWRGSRIVPGKWCFHRASIPWQTIRSHDCPQSAIAPTPVKVLVIHSQTSSCSKPPRPRPPLLLSPHQILLLNQYLSPTYFPKLLTQDVTPSYSLSSFFGHIPSPSLLQRRFLLFFRFRLLTVESINNK